MKKFIIPIIILIVGIIIFAVIFLSKRVESAKKLVPSVGKIKIKVNSLIDAITSILTGLPAEIPIVINNYSSDSFNISQIKTTISTVGGVLIAEQTKPINKSYNAVGGNVVTIPIDFTIQYPGLIALAKELGIGSGFDAVKNLVINYFTSGKFGASLKITGFVEADGLTVNINETQVI